MMSDHVRQLTWQHCHISVRIYLLSLTNHKKIQKPTWWDQVRQLTNSDWTYQMMANIWQESVIISSLLEIAISKCLIVWSKSSIVWVCFRYGWHHTGDSRDVSLIARWTTADPFSLSLLWRIQSLPRIGFMMTKGGANTRT